MSNSTEDNRFDFEIRKKYERHALSPDDNMWEKIYARLAMHSSIHVLHKIRNLKIAVIITTTAFIGTLLYYEISISGKHNQNIVLSKKNRIKERPSTLHRNILREQNKFNLKKSYQSTDTTHLFTTPPGLIPKRHEAGKGVMQTQNHILTNTQTGNSSKIKRRPKALKNLPVSSVAREAALSSKENLILQGKEQSKSTINKKRNKIKETKQEREKLQTIPPRLLYTEHHKPMNIIFSAKTTPLDHIVSAKKSFSSKLLNPLNANYSPVLGRRYSLTFYICPTYSYRSLADNRAFSTPPYDKSYFNDRDQGDISYAAGALFTYSFRPKIRLESGVYYFNYTYDFKTQATYVNVDQGYNWFYTSAGILNFHAYLSDTLLQNALLKSKMKFSYLSIPLHAEYDFSPSIFMNIGMNISFLIGKDLQMQAIDYTGDFDFQAGDIQHLHSYNLNIIIGLGFRQAINKNMSFIINPAFRASLTTLNDQATVKSYPYTVGLSAGLRYYF